MLSKEEIREKNKIRSLQNINLDEVTQGRKSGVEENIKQKVIIPILELLGYNRTRDIDFEHIVRNKKADIALLVDKKPKLIVECKSIEQDLDKHVEQALNYAFHKGVSFVILTNGIEIRLYKSFIENVAKPKDRLLIKIALRDLSDYWTELKEWASYESITSDKIEKLSKKREEEIGIQISAPNLLENLKRAKMILIENCKPKIESKYDTDKEFREKVNRWIENSELDIENEEEWIDRLAKEITYTFINRLYFYRIAEDFKLVKPKLTKSTLPELTKSFSIKEIIKSGFNEILEIDYSAIFSHNLFDLVEFDDNVLERIVFQLSEYNFRNLSADILGKIYEQHISRDERKSLGQFYTPEWIINFIIKRVPITRNKTILDPACGSGGFLIRAYEKLKNNYELDKIPESEIHNLILKKNLFGFDINPFAVQLTATNLVLRDLKNKTEGINVFEKDSLSSSLEDWSKNHFRDLNNQSRFVNLAETFPKKFDIVVGNPPYFNLKLSDIKKKYPNEGFGEIATGKTNIASLFLKKYVETLNEGGSLGFVVPKSLLYVEPWKPTRKYILNNCRIKAIYDLREAFEGVKLEQIIIILKKEISDKSELVDIFYLYYTKSGLKEKHHKVKESLFTDDYFPIYSNDINDFIFNKTNQNSIILGDFCDITRGPYLQKYKQILTKEKTTENDLKVMVGRDIGRYEYKNYMFLNPENRKAREFDKKIERISKERIVSQRIVAQTRNHIKIIANYDKGENINVDTVINIISEDKRIDVKYLLAVINSRFAAYYLYNFVYNRAVRSMNFEYVKKLPIKLASKDEQKEITEYVNRILRLNQEKNLVKDKKEKAAILKEVKELEKEIDKKIYKVYGLSHQEIEEIENLD